MNLHRLLVLPALALAALAAMPPAAAAPAAEVTMVTGRGTAVDAAGNVRNLDRGATVESGEIVSSGAGSFVNLKFTDGSFMLLRPNSRLQIEDYRYAGAPASAATPAPAATPAAAAPATVAADDGGVQRGFFRLLKGGLRAVTGLLGKGDPEEYRFTTPVATIGIRGTDYVTVICDAACAADPVVRASVAACDPAAAATGSGQCASAEGGVVVSVVSGGVEVTSDSDTGLIGTDQNAVILEDGSVVILPDEPRFLEVDPIPNPLTCS